MKRSTTRTRISAALAAAAAAACLIGAAGDAGAATRTSWVGPTPPGQGGQIYLTTSTINNAPLEASSRIYTGFGNSVASGNMGVQARLFKSGVLCQITSYVYNPGPTNNLSTATYGHCGTGSYNSHGFVKYWTGTEYGDFLTFPTDPLNYTAPAARSADNTSAVAPIKNGRNSRGQSIGTAENARTDSDLPELIAAFSTDGKQGYVRKTDVIPATPASPAQAADLSSKKTKTVPVYTENGTTQIGTFTVR